MERYENRFGDLNSDKFHFRIREYERVHYVSIIARRYNIIIMVTNLDPLKLYQSSNLRLALHRIAAISGICDDNRCSMETSRPSR